MNTVFIFKVLEVDPFPNCVSFPVYLFSQQLRSPRIKCLSWPRQVPDGLSALYYYVSPEIGHALMREQRKWFDKLMKFFFISMYCVYRESVQLTNPHCTVSSSPINLVKRKPLCTSFVNGIFNPVSLVCSHHILLPSEITGLSWHWNLHWILTCFKKNC